MSRPSAAPPVAYLSASSSSYERNFGGLHDRLIEVSLKNKSVAGSLEAAKTSFLCSSFSWWCSWLGWFFSFASSGTSSDISFSTWLEDSLGIFNNWSKQRKTPRMARPAKRYAPLRPMNPSLGVDSVICKPKWFWNPFCTFEFDFIEQFRHKFVILAGLVSL